VSVASRPSFRRILVAVDFSASSARALELGVDLARASGAELQLLSCHPILVGGLALSPWGASEPVAWLRGLRDEITRRLDGWCRTAAPEGVACTTQTSDQEPAEAIVGAAERIAADLVVMGTRGNTGVKHLLLGSVAERVLRTAGCPVWVERAPRAAQAEGHDVSPAPPSQRPPRTPKRLLFATDFGASSQRAGEMAGSLARCFEAELHVLHAFEVVEAFATPYGVDVAAAAVQGARDAARGRLDRVIAELSADGRVVHGHFVDGRAADAVVRTAARIAADAVVVGTHGYAGARHLLLGSVAERVARTAPCGTLCVQGPRT
jgi:nucleotide-binding universal stress UspA family protein